MSAVKLLIVLLSLVFLCFNAGAIVINEFVVDPQTDWGLSGGNATSSDEWVELYNPENSAINLTGWYLILNDTTPAKQILSQTISAKGYVKILNPTGAQNNDGQIILYNNQNIKIDSVTYGKWNSTSLSNNAPTGNAKNISNECLARYPNGVDTNIDKNDFIKTICTYGASNGGEGVIREICGNLLDDDNDGKYDYADSDCVCASPKVKTNVVAGTGVGAPWFAGANLSGFAGCCNANQCYTGNTNPAIGGCKNNNYLLNVTAGKAVCSVLGTKAVWCKEGFVNNGTGVCA